MKHIKLATLAAALTACLAPMTAAEADSMRDIIGYEAVGGGPGVFGVVPATSMVSIYGSMDVGLDYTNAGGKTVTRVESGNEYASKWGIYGQEYLGSQWTAFFRLESAFNLNNGTVQSQTSFFNRASYVGLSSPVWGTVSVGRQLSGEGAMAIGSDVFLANGHHSISAYLSGYSDLGYGANVDLSRVNNSISYTTPNFGPFSANLFYALKSNQTVGPRTKNASITFAYATSKNIATASYSQTYCDADPSASTPCLHDATIEPSVRTDNVLLSYLHDFGGFTGAASYLWNHPRFPGDHSSQTLVLGAEKMISRNLLRASVGYRDTTQTGNHAWGVTLGEDYFLSKRTSLYARFGFLKNGPKSAQTYNFDTTDAFPLPAMSKSVVSTTIGVLHNF
ncbi:Outer membrane porin protein 32 [Paraburkholderia caffeinitolerans]|uniref:Outer membrane porin protein 32 n=1 Tax=Paraburkholderia caffeinitolerans TaxID=1723730 RepID=A0A6J5GPM8_9BURK|nr:porin [Paraburkholderia caffeinitolerans]CAB3801228.1 Outer membrane porin protein 32 [Paraburkholderia caffeinitolerans]